MKTRESGAVKSAIRTLDVLELFARVKSPLNFKGIATELDIPPSSLSHLLSSLVDRGYVNHVGARGGYVAGDALVELARNLLSEQTLEEKALPFLEDLSAGLGESAGLTTMVGDEVVILASASSEKELSYRIKPGEHSPLHLKAAGKVLLAQCRDEEIDSYIRRTEFVALTPYTLRSGKELWKEILTIRESGIARSIEQGTAGVAGIAILVGRYRGTPVALTVGLPSARYNQTTDQAICRQIRTVAEQLRILMD